MKNAEKAQTIRKAVKTGVGEKRLDMRPLRKLGKTRVGNESGYQKNQKKLRREKKRLDKWSSKDFFAIAKVESMTHSWKRNCNSIQIFRIKNQIKRLYDQTYAQLQLTKIQFQVTKNQRCISQNRSPGFFASNLLLCVSFESHNRQAEEAQVVTNRTRNVYLLRRTKTEYEIYKKINQK